MSEGWILELLASVRDAARSHAMTRLAEHLDDAILVAASEFHETARVAGGLARHDGEDRATAGGVAGGQLH
jgi:uncharacterized protein (DUF1501 family)